MLEVVYTTVLVAAFALIAWFAGHGAYKLFDSQR